MLETYNDYLKIDKNIDKQWIFNIIDHKSESEDIIYENNDVIIIPDYKWNRDNKSLHVLGIYKDKSLFSIRELNNSHIKILEESIKDGKKIIEEKYGFDSNNLIIYFHYYPSVWQLHIHFMNNKYISESYSLPRAHLASTVIENLKIDSEYYRKVKLEIK